VPFALQAAGERPLDRQRKLRRRLDGQHVAHICEYGQALQRMKAIGAPFTDARSETTYAGFSLRPFFSLCSITALSVSLSLKVMAWFHWKRASMRRPD